MVRSRDVRRSVLLVLLAVNSTTAWAEAPLDWYVDLKREAKYARIAAGRGASAQELRPFEAAGSRLIARIDTWDAIPVSTGAHRLCLMAAQNFVAALSKYSADARHGAIVAGEPQRDACLTAIQRR